MKTMEMVLNKLFEGLLIKQILAIVCSAMSSTNLHGKIQKDRMLYKILGTLILHGLKSWWGRS